MAACVHVHARELVMHQASAQTVILISRGKGAQRLGAVTRGSAVLLDHSEPTPARSGAWRFANIRQAEICLQITLQLPIENK